MDVELNSSIHEWAKCDELADVEVGRERLSGIKLVSLDRVNTLARNSSVDIYHLDLPMHGLDSIDPKIIVPVPGGRLASLILHFGITDFLLAS